MPLTQDAAAGLTPAELGAVKTIVPTAFAAGDERRPAAAALLEAMVEELAALRAKADRNEFEPDEGEYRALDDVRFELRRRIDTELWDENGNSAVLVYGAGDVALRNIVEAYVRLGGDLELDPMPAGPSPVEQAAAKVVDILPGLSLDDFPGRLEDLAIALRDLEAAHDATEGGQA